VLTYTPYAIVLDGCGFFEGLKTGFWVLRRSLADTIIAYAIVYLLSSAVYTITFPFRLFGLTGTLMGAGLSMILSWLWVLPFTTFIWIQLYRSKMI